jgi:topoisomerase-4 subunit A
MENEEEDLTLPKKNDDIVHHGHRENKGDLPVSGLYENWFLEYASYVILERAVPNLYDGLKPVQRRILHVMKEMDDGRFNKVANIIGSAMQYHPHGDAAIGEAIVNLGQKDLMIETQGNWGDIRTGDSAAAPRYIEARLSKFALEVTFNEENTDWQISYDGRKREPITLPVKFPLVLAQGVEGIAVGLATKIMPHNFIELCEASIDILKGKKPSIYPDFPTGGLADFSNYNEGRRGGKIRCRAKIESADGKKVLIKDIPFTTTTESVIDSILKANESGKIKIKKVIDNTAKDVEIEVQLTPGVSTDMTIDALYAFTDCEVSISPNACVIADDKPLFLGVNDMLKLSTEQTLLLLKKELENELKHLENRWHFSSLEKIFIENKIYRHIEECESWEEILTMIDAKIKPFKKLLKREVTLEDIAKLPEIKIKRISKYDSFKADELMKSLENQIDEINNHLNNLIEYAIEYFKNLIKKYGKGKERKTEIRMFDKIETNVVAVANEKLYVNYAEGFVGYSLKKDEYVCDCSDIDDVIVFRKNGTYLVSKVSEKQFMGKDILYVDVYRKNDERKVYNVAYYDGKTGVSYVKRFNVLGVIRDKEYEVTLGTNGSKMLYFSANNNSEAEKIAVHLSNMANAKKKYFEFDFSEIEIKGRTAKGNILTKHPIRKVELKEKGKSTFKGREIWYDGDIGRLNVDGRGQYLGTFTSDDKILIIFNDGNYELTDNELSNRYEDKDIYLIQKFHEKQAINCIHYDVSSRNYYAKRFLIETSTIGKKFMFINERPSSKLILASTHENPEVEIKTVDAKGEKLTEIIKLADFIEIKGWKATGNKITYDTFKSAKLISEKVGTWEEEVKEEVISESIVPEIIADELDGQKTLF